MALIALLAVLALYWLITYAHTHRADGKPSLVWDCGDAGCKYRNRSHHKPHSL